MRNIPLVLRSVLLMLAAFGVAASAQAADVTFTVGAGADCTHSTIQAAINALPPGGNSSLRVSNTLSYTAQALSIDGKNITLTGGFADCTQTVASGTTTLSGQGGSHDSVLTVVGNSNVLLQRLTITRGDEVFDGYGGGIDYRGVGKLTLRDVVVSQNYAGYGGGINFSPTSGNGELWIEANTVIQNNTAQFSGGGVRVASTARLFVLADNVAITGNEAIGIDPNSQQSRYGNGGGVEVIGPARADIGSPGFGNSGVITANRARYGGGISLHGGDDGDDDDVEVRLFTTDPARPVRISGNRATVIGGAVYSEPSFGPTHRSYAKFCAFDFRFDGNRAQNGAALYADYDNIGIMDEWGSDMFLNSSDCGPESRSTLGAQSCAVGVLCNSIDGNIVENDAGQATEGATIFIQRDSHISANRVSITGNRGDQVLRVVDADAQTNSIGKLSGCLIADNQVIEVVRGDSEGSTIELNDCTIAGNTISGPRVLTIGDDLMLHRSILWQPGKLAMNAEPDSRVVEEVISNDVSTLGAGPSVVNADPRFMDPARGDYHLQAASPAVDFSAAGGGLDVDGRPRGVDLNVVFDRFGRSDLGAFERQSVGNVVRDPGFSADLHLWTIAGSGIASWSSAGASTPGSALFVVSPSQPAGQAVVGLTQCIRVPGPGSYRLSGMTYGDGNGVRRDYAYLSWRYFRDTGGENCGSTALTSGSLFFPRSAAFSAPLAPSLIDIQPLDWTRYSAIEVSLVAAEGNTMSVDTTSAHFDDIVFEPFDDKLFANGFEP
jgi:hypothetical protein